jgi:hypothetical protein
MRRAQGHDRQRPLVKNGLSDGVCRQRAQSTKAPGRKNTTRIWRMEIKVLKRPLD